ncbi:MAG: DUF4157 domain-containing protein [Bacteroidota bacterium]
MELQKTTPIASRRKAPRLRLHPQGDRCEKQADAIAQGAVGGTARSLQSGIIQRKSTEGVGQRIGADTASRLGASKGGGRPLTGGLRQSMERAVGADFSSVRIHTDHRAQGLNQELQAKAFTHGKDIYFNRGAFQPSTREGQKLLAHELTHVVQQRGTAPAIQRTPLPNFSVNTDVYERQVRRAVQSMQGNILRGYTLVDDIHPILSAMVSNISFRNRQGQMVRNGGTASYRMPGSNLTLSLGLVLDDNASTSLGGQFRHSSATSGTMVLMIQKNQSISEIALTMYHEAMHMLHWIQNRRNAPRLRAHNRRARTALLNSRSTSLITSTQRRFGQLIALVNLIRGRQASTQANRRSAIASNQAQAVAEWMVEEINVRSETEIYRLAASVQANRRRTGPSIIIDTSVSTTVNQRIVMAYIFDHSNRFSRDDIRDATSLERRSIQLIMSSLLRTYQGMFRLAVRRRISLVALSRTRGYTPLKPGPMRPLRQPKFRNLPLP